MVSPARRAAYERAARLRAGRVRRSRARERPLRGSTSATGRRTKARLRDDPARSHARLRDRGARQAAREKARPARSGGASASAPTSSASSTDRRHAAANESVEFVRVARLERAVAFTNAVLRRVGEGIRGPCSTTLPEGALRHSYPDWVDQVWQRDFGARRGARADAGAERAAGDGRPARSRRADGEPTDVPGAFRVDRVDERARARRAAIWPQSRGSQLAALVVGSREGERTLDLCAAPGGKATQLAGEVVAVEKHEGRARELEENVGAPRRARTSPSCMQTRSSCRRSSRLRPCARGRAVLGPRRACLAPDLRWRAKPLPELQLELLRAAAERVRPGGTIVYSVCTINADENEAVVDASGLDPEPLGDEWPDFAHPTRPEFLLTLPHVHRTSGFFIARFALLDAGVAWARLDPDGRGRAVALRGRLLAAGEQIERLLRRGLRGSSTSTSATGTSSSRSPSARSCSSRSPRLDPRCAAARVDVPPDDRDARAALSRLSGGRRGQRHLPRTRPSTTSRRSPRRTGEHDLQSASRSSPRRAPRRRPTRSREPTSTSSSA